MHTHVRTTNTQTTNTHSGDLGWVGWQRCRSPKMAASGSAAGFYFILFFILNELSRRKANEEEQKTGARTLKLREEKISGHKPNARKKNAKKFYRLRVRNPPVGQQKSQRLAHISTVRTLANAQCVCSFVCVYTVHTQPRPTC